MTTEEKLSWISADGVDKCDLCERRAVVYSLGRVTGRVYRTLCADHAPPGAVEESTVPLADRRHT